MDFFIATVIPQVLSQVDASRWFFLRFVDPYGLHVRLRLRARRGESAALRRAAMLACHRGLDALGTLLPDEYRPLVVPPEAPDPAWREQALVSVRSTAYEPELEKYGGEPGMPAAEELFEASSRIAVAVLQAERGEALSRKTMAPCLMALAADVFWPRDAAPSWSDYATFWLGGDTAFAREWRERFFDQARLLRDQDVSVVPDAGGLPAPAGVLLAEWTRALRRAHAGYRRLGTFREFPAEELGSRFIHTMNNRLGLSPLEEAYLATLLEDRAAGVVAA